jgi:hypothetical protein
MTALLTGAGRYDRRAIMRKAHAEFRASMRRGRPWTFARCLQFAWAVARGQRARLSGGSELSIAASQEGAAVATRLCQIALEFSRNIIHM